MQVGAMPCHAMRYDIEKPIVSNSPFEGKTTGFRFVCTWAYGVLVWFGLVVGAYLYVYRIWGGEDRQYSSRKFMFMFMFIYIHIHSLEASHKSRNRG